MYQQRQTPLYTVNFIHNIHFNYNFPKGIKIQLNQPLIKVCLLFYGYNTTVSSKEKEETPSASATEPICR